MDDAGSKVRTTAGNSSQQEPEPQLEAAAPREWGSRVGTASSFSRKTRNLTFSPSILKFSM